MVDAVIPLFLSIFVPALVATEFTTWWLLVTERERAMRRHRKWLAHGTEWARPDYRPVLREMRAEREAHGVPASFETEAVA